MSNKLQLDVCHHNQWWRRLVNAYDVKAVCLQVKLCDPYLSALRVTCSDYKDAVTIFNVSKFSPARHGTHCFI